MKRFAAAATLLALSVCILALFFGWVSIPGTGGAAVAVQPTAQSAQSSATDPGIRPARSGVAQSEAAETHLVHGWLQALPKAEAFSENSEAEVRQILRDGDEILARIKRENREALAQVNRQLRVKRCDAPNIVLIVADDVGYGDLGCYGQQLIRTPRLDEMAAEGVRFTDFYAGSCIGAPSRCTLMTGLHTGHCRVRGRRVVPLRPEDITVAEVLWKAGYKTGLVGKWDLGGPSTTGVPNRQGFYHYLGYLTAEEALDYWPEQLWLNEGRLPLPSNEQDRKTKYANDLFADEAVAFIERYRQEPFFLSVNFTTVHAPLEVPDDEPYHDKDWPQWAKNYAAMITRLDGYVGRILDTIDELNLADRTIVFFTSDNGPHEEDGADPEFFRSSGPFRGIKGQLYEGGIRVPMIVRWTGRIGAGGVSRQVWAGWDFSPTAADLANAMRRPRRLDGLSMARAIAGGLTGDHSARPVVADHEYLYWELPQDGQLARAVRWGKWKAVRHTWDGPIELYDLSEDPAESNDVAADHAEIVRRIEQFMNAAHADPRGSAPAAKKKRAGKA